MTDEVEVRVHESSEKHECPVCGHRNTDDMGNVFVKPDNGGDCVCVNLIYCHECDVEFDARIEGKLSDEKLAELLEKGEVKQYGR